MYCLDPFYILLLTLYCIVSRGRAPWLGTISKCMVRVSYYCLALFPLYLEWPHPGDLPPNKHTQIHLSFFPCVQKMEHFFGCSMKILCRVEGTSPSRTSLLPPQRPRCFEKCNGYTRGGHFIIFIISFISLSFLIFQSCKNTMQVAS